MGDLQEQATEIRRLRSVRLWHEQQGEDLLREAPSVSQAVALAVAARAQAHFVAAAYYNERSKG